MPAPRIVTIGDGHRWVDINDPSLGRLARAFPGQSSEFAFTWKLKLGQNRLRLTPKDEGRHKGNQVDLSVLRIVAGPAWFEAQAPQNRPKEPLPSLLETRARASGRWSSIRPAPAPGRRSRNWRAPGWRTWQW